MGVLKGDNRNSRHERDGLTNIIQLPTNLEDILMESIIYSYQIGIPSEYFFLGACLVIDSLHLFL